MISLIVATDEEDGIGKNGQIPWHYTEDLKHFARLTKGSTCIMGRVTAEDIMKSHDNPFILPNRQSIIITSNLDYIARDAIIASSLKEAMHKATNDKIFIIGGARLYVESLPIIEQAFITFVPNKHGCDVNISPVIDYIMTKFVCVSEVISTTGLAFNNFKRLYK